MKRLKKVTSVICVFMIVCISFVGCNFTKNLGTYNEGDTVYKDESRFVYEEDGKLGGMDIIRDRETGVMYIFYSNHYRAGICPLYDSEGNIVIDKER